MQLERIDSISEQALKLHLSAYSDSEILHQICEKWPKVSGLEICFSLTSAGIALERMFKSEKASQQSSLRFYKLTSILSADLFELQVVGNLNALGRDLLVHWNDRD